MSLLTNECSICFENFKNADVIYTTSCGHIFHFHCMEQWQRNGRDCPECRTTSPTTHKIYLTFEETQPQNPQTIQELELKLQSSNELNRQLNDEKNDVELNFMQIQEQFTALEEEKKILERRINEMNDSETNFMNLSKQYTESTEYVKYLKEQIKDLQQQNKDAEETSKCIRELECKIEELTIQNEQNTEKLRLKCLEIENLKIENETEQSTISDSILSGRIKILEQKLKYITNELEKEIANSSKLAIDKLKLESTIEQLKSAEKINKNIPNKETKNNKKLNHNKVDPINDQPNLNQTNNMTSTKIFIKDLPTSELALPLENIIINLATKMNMTLHADDIVQVKHIENNNKKSSKIQFMAEFKNLQLKTEFFAKKHQLKNHSSTKGITIGEYMDDELHSLVMYAREKLRNNGYDHIFCKNNMVFAKKHRNHPRSIHINDKAHVDSLLKRKESVELQTKDEEQSIEGSVDENYYQL